MDDLIQIEIITIETAMNRIRTEGDKVTKVNFEIRCGSEMKNSNNNLPEMFFFLIFEIFL